MNRGVMLLVAGAAFFVGRRPDRQADPAWRDYDGRQWVTFSPGEKRAYLAGFLSGRGLAEAEAAAGPNADSGRVHSVLDSLERASGLHYAYGHMVYASQLDEFYWWENHVPIRLYLALRHLNDGMRQGTEQ
jgi:hypothetical protein